MDVRVRSDTVPRAARMASKTKRLRSGCWEWTGFRNPNGYGVVRTGSGRGSLQLAHRAAWEEARGPIPADMCVCHRCDNRGCVRPEHLFLGTLLDNLRDMDAKGRRTVLRGQDHHAARLTDGNVRSIRSRWRDGTSPTSLAAEYGVTREAIYRITTGHGWKHVT